MPKSKTPKNTKSGKSTKPRSSKRKKNNKSGKEVVPEQIISKKIIEEVVEEVAEEVVEKVVKNAKNTTANEDDKINVEFTNIVDGMKTLIQDVRGILKSSKLLQVRVIKRVRALNKKQKGSKKRGINQKKNPSGFNKPTLISDDLAIFLKIDKGSLLPRTDVTRKINTYIKEHSLQGILKPGKDGVKKIDNRFINTKLPSSDKRYRVAKKLHTLLNPTVDLSYFNLQTFLSPHFIKTAKI